MVDQTPALAAPPLPPPPPDAVPRSSGWSGSTPSGSGRAEFSHPVGYAIAAIPLAFALLLEVLSHDFLAPLWDHRVSLLGLPGGTFFAATVVLLTILGAVVVRNVRSFTVVGAVLIFTTSIGLALVIMSPAIILILINLHS